MLATISVGVVLASLLTKFMFLYDDKTRFYGVNFAQFIRQHDGKCEDGADTKPLLAETKRASFHELGLLLRVRTREHM